MRGSPERLEGRWTGPVFLDVRSGRRSLLGERYRVGSTPRPGKVGSTPLPGRARRVSNWAGTGLGRAGTVLDRAGADPARDLGPSAGIARGDWASAGTAWDLGPEVGPTGAEGMAGAKS